MLGQHRRRPLQEEEDRLREAITRLRTEKGLSQRELSAKLGLYPMTIGKIERVERSVAVIELIRIANAMAICPNDLLKSIL